AALSVYASVTSVGWTTTSSRRVNVQDWVPSSFMVEDGISVARSGSNRDASPGTYRIRALKTMSRTIQSWKVVEKCGSRLSTSDALAASRRTGRSPWAWLDGEAVKQAAAADALVS